VHVLLKWLRVVRGLKRKRDDELGAILNGGMPQ
jgi:hypothetical protein